MALKAPFVSVNLAVTSKDDKPESSKLNFHVNSSEKIAFDKHCANS